MIGLLFVFGYMALMAIVILVAKTYQLGSFRECWTADDNHPIYAKGKR